MTGDSAMTFQIIQCKPNAVLFAAVLALGAAQAEAGVLYGTDYDSYNGRSGRPTDSLLSLGRDGNFGAYCQSGASSGRRTVVYPFDIKNGYEIFSVRVWGFDDSASNNLSYEMVQSCQPFLSGGAPVRTVLATAASSGSPGEFSEYLYLDQHVATSSTCAYFLEARFAPDNSACAGFDLRSVRVRVLSNNPDVIFRNGFAPWGS